MISPSGQGADTASLSRMTYCHGFAPCAERVGNTGVRDMRDPSSEPIGFDSIEIPFVSIPDDNQGPVIRRSRKAGWRCLRNQERTGTRQSCGVTRLGRCAWIDRGGIPRRTATLRPAWARPLCLGANQIRCDSSVGDIRRGTVFSKITMLRSHAFARTRGWRVGRNCSSSVSAPKTDKRTRVSASSVRMGTDAPFQS